MPLRMWAIKDLPWDYINYIEKFYRNSFQSNDTKNNEDSPLKLRGHTEYTNLSI